MSTSDVLKIDAIIAFQAYRAMEGFITLQEVEGKVGGDGNDKKNWFIVRKPLAGTSYGEERYSFESYTEPGSFMSCYGLGPMLKQNNKTNDFAYDSTYIVHKRIINDTTYIKFGPINQPDNYIAFQNSNKLKTFHCQPYELNDFDDNYTFRLYPKDPNPPAPSKPKEVQAPSKPKEVQAPSKPKEVKTQSVQRIVQEEPGNLNKGEIWYFLHHKEEIEKTAYSILEEILAGRKFSTEEGEELSNQASTAILEELSKVFPLVKFFVITLIAKADSLSIHIYVSSLIEKEKDGSAYVVYEGEGFIAQTYIFVVPI